MGKHYFEVVCIRTCIAFTCNKWGILQERVYRYQIGDVDRLKERLIYELCHFDQRNADK